MTTPKILAEFDYPLQPVDKGYTDRTLYVNVSDNRIESKPVPQEMKDIFIGGRGYGLKLLWQAINENTKWDDPENELVIASGPIGGITQYPGTGKSIVVGLSPLTNIVVDSNVGGYYGPYLKFAGWDGIVLEGRAESPVWLDIRDNDVHLRDARTLWGKDT